MSRRGRRWMLAAAAAAAAALFLGRALARLPPDPVLRAQLEDYAVLGGPLAHDVFVQGQDPSYRMPLSTLAAERLLHHWPFSRRATAAGFLCAEAALVIVLGFAAFGESLAAPLALAALAFVDSDLQFHCFWLETPYAILLLLAAGLLALNARRPSPLTSLAAGCGIGATLLLRSPLALFPPLAAAAGWAGPRRRGRWRELAALCVAPYLFLAPWTVMNWRVHRTFSPIERQAIDDNAVAGALGLVRVTEGDTRAILTDGAFNPRRLDAGDWTLRQVLGHPLSSASAVARRLWYFAGLEPVLLALAAAAFWRGRRDPVRRQLALLAGYFVLAHCAVTVQSRYFLPVWPLFCLLAASLAPGASAPAARPSERFAAAAGLAAALAAWGWTSAAVLRYDRVEQAPEPYHFDKAIGASPSEGWLYAERGRRALAQADFTRARQDFARARSLEPDSPRWPAEEAWAAFLAGDPAPLLSLAPPPDQGAGFRRLELFERLAKIRARLRSGDSAAARGEARAAKALADGLIEVPESTTEAGEAARAAMVRGAPELLAAAAFIGAAEPAAERRRFYGLLADESPRAAELRLREAEAASAAGLKAEAGAAADRAAALEPSREQQRRLAFLYFHLGRKDGSRRLLALSRADKRCDNDAALLEAELAADSGDRDRALTTLDEARACPDKPLDDARVGGIRAALETRRLRAAISFEQKRGMALLYLRLGAFRRASALLGPLASSRPGDTSVWLDLASAAGGLGDPAAQDAALARARASAADPTAARVVIDRLRALGRTREAREAAEAKLAVWPDAADLRLAAAELAAAAGDAAGAAGHLEKLLPSIDGARLADRAAACYLQAGLLAAARAKLEAFLHRWPSDGGLLLDSAELRLLRGDRKGAAAAAARAEGDLPPRRGAALASLWRRLHEPRRALALLDGLLARGGYDAGLWLEKAETHALLFEKDAAHKALANALAPGAPPVEPLRVARVRQLLLEFSEEVEALKRVVAEPGASSAALAAAADAQADRGAKSDALSLLARAEERAPSLDQRRRIAAVYRRLAQCARARSVLAPVLSARPNEAVVLIEEGLNDAVCADARSARKALARLASAEPGPDADLRAPLILWRLGSKDEALARWSAAAASLPRPGDWWVEETIFALRRGDRELARAQLAKARAAEPGPSRRLDALERRAARGTP